MENMVFHRFNPTETLELSSSLYGEVKMTNLATRRPLICAKTLISQTYPEHPKKLRFHYEDSSA